MTQPEPTCPICTRRQPPDGYLVCLPCQASIEHDLDQFTDLALLLPAAVAPSLAQPLLIGSRATEAPMPGGEALNLTAGTVDGVQPRLIPLVRTVRETERFTVTVRGQTAVGEHTIFSREHAMTDDGQPVYIPDGDQVGPLGPWVMLGRWIATWVKLRNVGETGHGGVDWLRQRVDWAYRAHPDIAGWVGELRQTVGGMRAILDVKRYVVRYKDRCPGRTSAGALCGAAGSLYRWIDPLLPEDDRRVRYINCGVCGTMFELDDERIGGQAA